MVFARLSSLGTSFFRLLVSFTTPSLRSRFASSVLLSVSCFHICVVYAEFEASDPREEAEVSHCFILLILSHRLRITSQNLGSSSIMYARRPTFSAAAMVLPDPPKGSRTISFRFVELRSALIASQSGFSVGWR